MGDKKISHKNHLKLGLEDDYISPKGKAASSPSDYGGGKTSLLKCPCGLKTSAITNLWITIDFCDAPSLAETWINGVY